MMIIVSNNKGPHRWSVHGCQDLRFEWKRHSISLCSYILNVLLAKLEIMRVFGLKLLKVTLE